MIKSEESEWLSGLVARYGRHGILVDSNILLLLFIGTYDRALISKFKRTQTFDEQDFETLVDLLVNFGAIHTTAHVLAEVSNLSWSLPARLIEDYAQHFIQTIHRLSEHHMLGVEIVEHEIFPKLGLSDAYLAALASRYLLLTDDWALSNFVAIAGGDVINFNHLRGYGRAS